ncbi:MAG TPA: N-acetyltransferase [Dehalococcoidia bacterium]|nr:N-acetyltransferase [Dehalococcoidia bacterium]
MSDATPSTAPPTLVLRPTREADLDSVLAIERHPENAPFIGQWPREQHELTLRREGAEHSVVEAGSAIGGYLITYDLTADAFGIWLQRLAVIDKSRGVGRSVLAAYLTDAMPRLGADSAILDVMRVNERAQAMYRSLGFAEAMLPDDDLERLKNLVGGMDDDVIVMRLPRAPAPQERYEVRLG